MYSTIKKHIVPLVSLVLVMGLYSCQEKIDLNNIDTRFKADMGVALPVGEMKFTANDFLGGGQVQEIHVDGDGSFYLQDTVDMPKQTLPSVDLTKYVAKMEDQFKVKKYIEPGVLNEDGWVTKHNKPITISFPKTIKLDGVNTGDENVARLDSAQVLESLFQSIVNKENFDLKWEWIEYVDIQFNKQFAIKGGAIQRVYTKGQGYGYNTNIPVTVKDYTVSLIKDMSKDPGWDNVVDTVGIKFILTFILPTGQNLQVKDNSQIIYSFTTDKIGYASVWGWFFINDHVKGRQSIALDSLFGKGWKDFTKKTIKLMEPEFIIGLSHHQSAPLLVTMEQLYTKNASEVKKAKWGDQESQLYYFNNAVAPTKPVTDSVWNELTLDYKAENGNIANLFQIAIDSLCYNYDVAINPTKDKTIYPYLQHRMTNQTQLYGRAAVKIPFKLDKGSQAEYITKITNIKFDKLSIDSLLQKVKQVESGKANELKLFLTLTNAIPWKIDAKVWFLRADSSRMDLNLFPGQDNNQITLPAPKMTIVDGKYGKVTEPSVSTIIVDITKQQLDSLVATARHLEIDAFAGDNTEPCVIDTTTWVKAQVGLAASVEAIVNLNNK